MKTFKHIPAGKIKKMLFPSCDSDIASSVESAAATADADAVTTPASTTTVSEHSVTLSDSKPTSTTPIDPVPQSIDPSVKTHFEGFKRLVPNQNHTKSITNNITVSTNDRPKSPKSGILIKRDHLKNFTIRKLSVVQRSSKVADTKNNNNNKNNNNSRMIRRSVQFSINRNSKDKDNNSRSLKTLIADLED